MKLKSIIIIILMLLFVFSAGCGRTKEDNGNQNPLSSQESTSQHQSQDNTNQQQGAVPENMQQASFDLNVAVKSGRNAILTIDGIDQALANANEKISKMDPKIFKALNVDAQVGIQWQINFDNYILLARFDNVQKDNPPVSYLLKQIESETVHLGSLETIREGNQMEISLTMPDGELDLNETEDFMLMVDFSVSFSDADGKLDEKAFQSLMDNLGGIHYSKSFSRSTMNALLPETVFPPAVYDMGFSEGPGDDTYFLPTTDDYVILPQPRDDGAPLEIHLLIEFDAAGYISNVIKRIGDPQSDEEMTKINADSYSRDYYVSSASYAGQYIYLTYSPEYLERINYPVMNQLEALSTKELMLENKKLTTSSGEEILFNSNQVFVSIPQLTEGQLSMPEYCKLDDFFLFPYRTIEPPSEDFVVFESKAGEAVYSTITYFDNQGNTILTEKIAYSEAQKIYNNAHPENANISYSVENGGEPKRSAVTPQARSLYYFEKNYRSYQEAIDAGDWAVYYSNPVLQ
ncbi:MAG: hypothetical protein GX625_07170 [Clostridiaceae bacterium]|nr:hypothetical protein [Clostridiaceae bacterium]